MKSPKLIVFQSSDEIFLAERGGEIEHKLEYTFIFFWMGILVDSNIPIMLTLG